VYWSSTSAAATYLSYAYAWTVDFADATIAGSDTNILTEHVRCVRCGQE
jgi:hypothetical protein